MFYIIPNLSSGTSSLKAFYSVHSRICCTLKLQCKDMYTVGQKHELSIFHWPAKTVTVLLKIYTQSYWWNVTRFTSSWEASIVTYLNTAQASMTGPWCGWSPQLINKLSRAYERINSVLTLSNHSIRPRFKILSLLKELKTVMECM